MIARYSIKCSTCDRPHTLRIQVGHSPYQEHTFNCVNCHENIVVGMDCDKSNASVQLREIENCALSKEEGDIINLSSEFTISENNLHTDMHFPAFEHMMNMHDKYEKEHGDILQQISDEDFHLHRLNFKMVSDTWPVVKKGWSLTSKGITDLAQKILSDYQQFSYDGPPQLNYILFDFCGHMLHPGMHHLFEKAAKLMQHISMTHPDEFNKFQKYYVDNIQEDNLSRYYDIFNEFFKCYSDFSQTLILMQTGIVPKEDQIASSSSFSKTRLFYGNAFELYTSNIQVLALLNNVYQGRHYDEFENMTLTKYQSINKANRSNPFKDTEPFFALCECLDSTIRNSSHHGAMKLDKKGRMITYQSGGTGKINHITYKEYIDKCNSIMLSSCALLSLELVIAFHFSS